MDQKKLSCSTDGPRSFRSYAGLEHSVSAAVLADAGTFLRKHLRRPADQEQERAEL